MDIIKGKLTEPTSPGLKALAESLLEGHEESIEALLFYGSCLRSGDEFDGVADVYVVVKDYSSYYKGSIPAFFNWLLPPNVYYKEVQFGKKRLSAKYAVISLKQLEEATSPRWFHSYFWARLCQPSRLLYVKDDDTLARMATCVANSIATFVARVVPCLSSPFSIEELWKKGLELTYRAEIRPEGRERAISIFELNRSYFKMVTPHVLRRVRGNTWSVQHKGGDFYILKGQCHPFWSCRLPWKLRMVIGKVLSGLRLIKATWTFSGSVDYAIWKIERHTGVRMELSPFLRRHPVLAMFFASWQLISRP